MIKRLAIIVIILSMFICSVSWGETASDYELEMTSPKPTEPDPGNTYENQDFRITWQGAYESFFSFQITNIGKKSIFIHRNFVGFRDLDGELCRDIDIGGGLLQSDFLYLAPGQKKNSFFRPRCHYVRYFKGYGGGGEIRTNDGMPTGMYYERFPVYSKYFWIPFFHKPMESLVDSSFAFSFIYRVGSNSRGKDGEDRDVICFEFSVRKVKKK